MTKRYGVPPEPESCGDADDNPCFSCTVRALRGRWGRHLRRWARQSLPLKYATHYFTGGPDVNEFINVDYWRMWFGRVFAHQHYSYHLAADGRPWSEASS